jgi:RsiW-degrading membrane proteinase PrsW (M82 family)
MVRSNAAQIIIALIPIVGIVMGSVVVFFYLLWNHKRKMFLIKTEQWKESVFDLLTFSLLGGLLLGAVGLCLTVFLAIVGGRSYGLLGGIIPLSSGIALLAFFSIKRFDSR